MTSPLWPSSRASATAAAALVGAALLLGLPASSFAGGDPRAAGPQTERGESSETALTSAGLLARGSGYGKQSGSAAVRELQRRLRGLDHRPGPVDGLFGPLTEASVERFQRARGLRVDGLVGRRTRGRLLAVTARRTAPPHVPATPKPSAPDRLTPDRPAPADVAPPRQPAPDAARPATRMPESSDGLDPWLAALLGALAAAVLLVGLSRLRRPRSGERAVERRPPRSRPNLGLAFAVLLAVFATGAAIGALFATHAAPGDRGGSEVASGALLSPPAPSPVAKPAEPPRPSRPAAPRRRARPAGTAPAPVPPPATSKPAEPSAQPAGAERAPAATAPMRPVAPVEKAGAPAEKADAVLALRVKRLVDLNLDERVARDGSDLLAAGERPRVP